MDMVYRIIDKFILKDRSVKMQFVCNTDVKHAWVGKISSGISVKQERYILIQFILLLPI